MPSPPSYRCCTRVNFVLKKHLLFQMNLSNSGLKNRSIKEYWLIFTVLKFPLGLQFSHNLTKFKIIKYISTIYIMTTTCTCLQQLTQVSDVAHGPLVLITVEQGQSDCREPWFILTSLTSHDSMLLLNINYFIFQWFTEWLFSKYTKNVNIAELIRYKKCLKAPAGIAISACLRQVLA